MLKLALRNITSKPFRAVATVLAVAVAVAMIFAMLSFSPAVYEYIYSTQTATSGRSDIRISTNSSSDRITSVTEPLNKLMNPEEDEEAKIEFICPSLTLYAVYEGEYVQLRGFEKSHAQYLQDIDTVGGDISKFDDNTDNVIISEAAAEHYGLQVGDRIMLSLGARQASFIVSAISSRSGYFLNDAPFLIVGRIEGIAKLLSGISMSQICNEIYIKAADGVDVDDLISEISAMPEYSQMLVQRSGDIGYIREQADSLSAPVVLSGAAVFALGIAVIVLLFMMSESEKVALVSKYSVVGATKKQIMGIFLTESVILACVGAVVGSLLAVGVFVGILKLTLSPTIVFTISALRLFGAAVIGIVSAIASSFLPILRAFRGTIRQNQTEVKKHSRLAKALCPVMIALTAVSVAIEFAVPSMTAVFAVISLALALATLGVCIASVLRLTARVGEKIPQPTVKVASRSLRRDGRFARSVTMLGVGMTVSMMLFMAWAMTKSVFSDYVGDFKDLVFVTNVRADVDTSGFYGVDGVDAATKIVWQQGSLAGDNFDKTMNILGTKDALDIVDFEFVTDKEIVTNLLYGNEHCIFVDKALSVLYGVKVGDELTMTMDGVEKSVYVGGILEHKLFSGNYIVISDDVIAELFGIKPDTVVVTANGNTDYVVNSLREKYASNNYYVVSVLTAYKWDMQSMDAVFNLVGTLAIVVALFIFAITVAAAMVGRGVAERGRVALLNAGMSKKSLLCSEILEHFAVALVSYALSFALSVLLTACLIHALRLFGMYFEFMYEAWVVATVGAVMALGYTAVPLAFGFKKRYTIKRNK